MPTLKLTKSVIDDLKPSATDQVYWDQTLRGFDLKVTPAGRKVFIVMYRTTDSRRLLPKYTLGPYGVLTLFSVRAAAQKILLARLDGQDPAAAKQASRRRPAGLRLEEVIAQYRTDYLEPRGVGGETLRILKRIMLTEWRGRQNTDISHADIRECIDSIMQRGAVAMAARAFRVVRAMFNWCVGSRLTETSPCVGLVPPLTGRPRERVLTDDELAVVLGSAWRRPGVSAEWQPRRLAAPRRLPGRQALRRTPLRVPSPRLDLAETVEDKARAGHPEVGSSAHIDHFAADGRYQFRAV